MKRECTCCRQDWAVTYDPMIGPVCRACHRDLAEADALLDTVEGMCRPPHYDALWWKQAKARGDVLV